MTNTLPAPQPFSLRGLPLLATGMTTTAIARADNLWIHAKVYSRGGENAMHAHEFEDHAFVVLQGEAIFEFADGSKRRVRPYEGVLLPKGSFYRFEARGLDNLVMVRIGGAQIGADWSGTIERGAPVEIRRAIDTSGQPLASGSLAKGRTPAESVSVLHGQFVAPD